MRLFLPVLMLAAASLLLTQPASGTAADAFETVVERQRALLLGKAVSASPETVRGWVDSLDAKGAWPDLNYHDAQPADWSPRYHLGRVETMCRYWAQPSSPLRGNPGLIAAAERALDYWIATRPQCPNWWHNQIGTPGFMRDIVVVLGSRLQGTRRAGALEVLHQFKVAGEGANLVWSAMLALSYGCLVKDDVLVTDCAARLAREVHVSRGEGIQADWSFHQHGKRLQAFHYGGAYLHDTARLAWTLAGTRWALPPEKVRILSDYVLGGPQWMARWNYTVPGTLDRSVSRADAMKIDALADSAALLAVADPARKTALEEVRARVERRAPPLRGFRAYPSSDFACYQRPDFSFFVKTISSRTFPTEVMNGENTQGWQLNGGDTYFLRNGDEYANLPPVWDWSLLPGVTGVAGLTQVDRQEFCGAVGDGESGCVAMAYQTAESKGNGRLQTRKAYFCHGDAVVCLVGGLSVHAGDLPARTALDQRRLRGPVVAGDRSALAHEVSPGETRLEAVRWLYHDGLVYVPTTPVDLVLKTGPATGAWRRVNSSGSKDAVTQEVFLPVLTHGANVDGASAGYAVFPCASATQAPGRAQTLGYRLLRNDAGCQAVWWADGTLMAAFYEPGEVHGGDKVLLAGVDQPCLLMSRPDGACVTSDPLHHGDTVRVSLTGRPELPTMLPPDGSTVSVTKKTPPRSP